MSDTPSSKVLTERRGPVLIVTLNRPEVKNACDNETAFAMNAAMDLLDDTDELFVGVITGAGGDFSAGADLKAAAKGGLRERPPRGGFGLFKRPSRKPLIAAVEGVAVGGGLFRLPKRIPYHIAMEVALSGTLRDPEFFARWGLVNRIVEPGQALATALEWADALLVNGPTALAATKEIVFQGANWTDEEGWDAQMPIAMKAIESEDRKEGLQAFVEKRKPVWKGR